MITYKSYFASHVFHTHTRICVNVRVCVCTTETDRQRVVVVCGTTSYVHIIQRHCHC